MSIAPSRTEPGKTGPSTPVVPFTVHGEGAGVAQTLTVAGGAGHVFHADAYPAFGGAERPARCSTRWGR